MESRDKTIQDRLEEAVQDKDYFLVRDLYEGYSQQMSPKRRLYWDTVYHNLFGNEYKSLVAAGRFLARYTEKDSDAAEVLYISAVNRLRRFRYRAAADTYRKLLRIHRTGMDSEEIAEAENNLAVCMALREVPPQRVDTEGIRQIPIGRTGFGHICARVLAGSHSGDFIVDTGANFSTVGRSVAAAMGIRIVAGEIEVGTATGIRIRCGLGYSPQLDLAGITVRNAVFIIMDDDHLQFPEIGYSIEGIIGMPVIRQMGDLRFSPGKMELCTARIPRHVGSNICFEGLMPLAEVYSNGERLIFTLDTGANQSEYSHGYYIRNGESLLGRTRSVKGLRGGGGGVVSNDIFMLRDEKLTVGGREVTALHMNVIPEDYEFSRGKDGNLGLDALMSTGGFTLSMRRMILYPRRPKPKAGKRTKGIHR